MTDSQRINCLAVEGSEPSKNAFNWYLKNYHQDGDLLIIIHVYQMATLDTTKNNYSQIVDKIESSVKLSNSIVNYYTEICKEKNIKYKAVIESNNPTTVAGKVICESVKRNLGNVIILGQRGLNKIKRYSVGSTSDYVLHQSDVPVVVVPCDKAY
ncbi:uncharacterized protein LOC100205153 [Hydra vulgaris]|uniref:uncharacterized protein LOC100205153 n=1 Tax=Hydra vulgaris TaxID=6087 RepID=UPI0001927519|nr:universal stress protein A-like protein [Hydra vulgaris]